MYPWTFFKFYGFFKPFFLNHFKLACNKMKLVVFNYLNVHNSVINSKSSLCFQMSVVLYFIMLPKSSLSSTFFTSQSSESFSLIISPAHAQSTPLSSLTLSDWRPEPKLCPVHPIQNAFLARNQVTQENSLTVTVSNFGNPLNVFFEEYALYRQNFIQVKTLHTSINSFVQFPTS